MPAHPSDLTRIFLDEAWEAMMVFGQTSEFLNQQQHDTLLRMAHRLKGTSGMYGYPQISSLASLIERIFESAPHYTTQQREQVSEFMDHATQVLIEGLENVASLQHEGNLGLALNNLGVHQIIQSIAVATPVQEIATPASSLDTAKNLQEELQEFFRKHHDFWEFFAPETQEHIDSTNAILARSVTPDDLQALFRHMHTIKGAAYSVGCQPVGKLAHRLEDLMVAVREGQRTWDKQVASTLQQSSRGHVTDC
jgi:chemosensory pili system protein ChpA (sensor histidine kinase/response regulator)